MKRFTSKIQDKDLDKLNQLIGKSILHIECPYLDAALNEKIFTSSHFKIPFYWTIRDEEDVSKDFKFSSIEIVDKETYVNYNSLNLEILDREYINDVSYQESPNRKLNSNIHIYNNFDISEIKVLTRNRIIENYTEITYDESILLISNDKRKYLFSASKLYSGSTSEFIYDEVTIENRIKELNVRKTLSNKELS